MPHEIISNIDLDSLLAHEMAIVGMTEPWSKFSVSLKSRIVNFESMTRIPCYTVSSDDQVNNPSPFYGYLTNTKSLVLKHPNIGTGNGTLILFKKGIAIDVITNTWGIGDGEIVNVIKHKLIGTQQDDTEREPAPRAP